MDQKSAAGQEKIYIIKQKMSCLSFNAGGAVCVVFLGFFLTQKRHFLELWIWAPDSAVGVFWFQLCHRLLQLMFMEQK